MREETFLGARIHWLGILIIRGHAKKFVIMIIVIVVVMLVLIISRGVNLVVQGHGLVVEELVGVGGANVF